jgi:hypothetical protein
MSDLKVTIQPIQGPSRTVVIEQPSLQVRISGVVDSAKVVKGDKGDIGPVGPVGPVGPMPEIKVDEITLNISHITTRSVTLSSQASSNWALLFPDRGTPQRYGIDFSLNREDNTIRWSNMGLDGVLRENDRIVIHYLT